MAASATTLALAAAGAFDDASDDDSLERQQASKRQRTIQTRPSAAAAAAAAAAPPPPDQTSAASSASVSAAADVPGQYRILQLPFPSGTRSMVVYEDASAGPGGRVWDAAVALAHYLAANVDAGDIRGCSVIEVGAGAGAPGMVAALMGAIVTLTDRPRVLPLMWRNAMFCNQAIAWGCGVVNATATPSASTDMSTDAAGNGDWSCQQGGVRVATLEWGGATKRLSQQCPHPPSVLPCPLVIASDVVGCGDQSLFPSLVKTFRDLTRNTTDTPNGSSLSSFDSTTTPPGSAPSQSSPRIIMSYKYRADFESEFFDQMSTFFDRKELSKYSGNPCTYQLRTGVVELDATLSSDFEQTADEAGDESTRRLLEQLGPDHAAAYRAALGLGDDMADAARVEDCDTTALSADTASEENTGKDGGNHSKIHIYEFRAR